MDVAYRLSGTGDTTIVPVLPTTKSLYRGQARRPGKSLTGPWDQFCPFLRVLCAGVSCPYRTMCWCLLCFQNYVLAFPALPTVAEWEPTVPMRPSCNVHLHWAASWNYSLVSLGQLHNHHQPLSPMSHREGLFTCSLKGHVDSNFCGECLPHHETLRAAEI